MLRFLKKLFIALLLFVIAFSGYVAIATRNVKDMTIRQRVLKAVYPAVTWWGRISGKNNKVFTNESLAAPPQSLYNLSIALSNGDSIPLSNYKGKKILLVNTASDGVRACDASSVAINNKPVGRTRAEIGAFEGV